MFDISVMESVPLEEVDRLGPVENLVHFRFGQVFRPVYTKNLLAQKFIKLLFTNPTKTDSRGGGLPKVIPSTFSPSMLPQIEEDCTLAVVKTEKDMTKEQIGVVIPDEERLKSAKFLGASWNQDKRVLSINIKVTSVAGDAWVVFVPVASGV